MTAEAFIALFWRKVNKTDTCWNWTGFCNEDGYGLRRWHGRKVYAHRFSWELHNGPIPAGLKVLHHCDNPPCIRPEHLFLGTQQDNIKDMDAKGRRNPARLERHGRAKLTLIQVRTIRQRRTSGEKCVPLAMEYKVAPTLISRIGRGQIWKEQTT